VPKTKTRKRYSTAKRQSILATAQSEGLTAAEVKKRFGVTPVTYYSWRKKYGAAASRNGTGARRGRKAGGGALSTQVRSEVQSKVRQMVADIVRSEVNDYLGSVFGTASTGARRGRRRRRGRPRKS
jgi:transposase-like protein